VAGHEVARALAQGHRVKSFREFLGRYSQSLTRWLFNARDRHNHQTTEPELHHSSKGTHPSLA